MAEAGPIGRRLRRFEDDRLLRGEGRFADDLQPEGCLFVAFLRSPVAHGNLRAIDTSRAAHATVFTARDLEGSCRPLGVHLTTPGAVSPDRPLLATDRVRFVGELIAAVVAPSRYAAADAGEALQPDIDPLPAVVGLQDAPSIHDTVPGNVYFIGRRKYGNPDAAFARADAVVECKIKHPRVAAAPIECRGVVAAPDGDGVTVWTSTQVPHMVADAIAECLQLPRERVRVVATDIGGAFGVKAQVYPEEVLLAWISRRMQTPVKWIETRSEHMQSSGHARDQDLELSAAVRKDGRILAVRATIYSRVGAYGVRPFGPLLDPLGTAGLIPGPYDIRDYEYATYALATNQSPEGPYRGVGMVTAVLAHERLIELTAARLGLDPGDVRRLNFVRAEHMPYTSVTGHPYESGDYPRALDLALRVFDYAGARTEQRRARSDGRALGVGIASYVEYTGAGSSTFERRGMLDIPGTDSAHLWVDGDGRVHVQTSCPALGQGAHTTLAQIAAAGFGVEPDMIVVEQTDTALVPAGTGTFMSRGSVTAATSVFRAATLLRELAEEKGELDVSVTYDATQAAHPYATHACLVEVEPDTGGVHILRYVVADDCGVLINPTIVEGQVTGGVAQGFGAATMEEVVYSAEGQLRSGTFLDYSIPSVNEVPDVAIEHLVTPSTVHELGTKGAGEGGTIGSTAAIANAIADALGLTDIILPLTPDRIARR